MMILDCADRDEALGHLKGFYEALGRNRIALSDTETRSISASAGFAWTKDANMDIDTLISRADEALYMVKRNTKGTYGEYTDTSAGACID